MKQRSLVEEIINATKYGALGPFSKELLRTYGDERVARLAGEIDDRRMNPFSVFTDISLDYKRLQVACALDSGVKVKDEDLDLVKSYSSQIASLDETTVDTLLLHTIRTLCVTAGNTISKMLSIKEG